MKDSSAPQVRKRFTTSNTLADFARSSPERHQLAEEVVQHYLTQFEEELAKGTPFTELIRAANEVIAEEVEEGKSMYQISCKKGCSACCHINVDIGPAEAKILLDYSRSKEINIDIAKLVEQSKITDDRAWLDSEHSACVFLGEDGVCKVYEVRPLACRKWNVISPATECGIKDNKIQIFFSLTNEGVVSALQNLEDGDSMPKMLLKELNINV
jgi:uncharacterized protein